MKRRTSLPELLAPAGSYDSLVAAVNAGADAVYFGAGAFNARAFAKNFDTDELSRALTYAHIHGVKAYITLNTLIYDKEIEDFIALASTAAKMGVDAAIVADMGAISLLRKHVPSLALHGSTQLSAHSADGINELSSLGLERVVLARELSLENIRLATDNSNAETEMFIHGALCVSHSGQCLFSSLVGGRSGNRGECAQACRLPYNSKYPLSLRDLSLSDHITEIIDSGVSSLKIEGRMKSPEYVYGVTEIYRRLLDEKRNATYAENERLGEIFSRSGFTDGYFTDSHKSKMTGIRTEDGKRKTSALSLADTKERRVNITASASFALGVPSRLSLTLGDRTVSVEGDCPQAAESSPLTHKGLAERLAKTGNTPFILNENDIEISLDGEINLAPSQINALRRRATDALAATFSSPDADLSAPEHDLCASEYDIFASERSPSAINGEGKKMQIPHTRIDCGAPFRSALFFSTDTYNKVRERDFFDYTFIPLFEIDRAKDTPSGVYLPPVVTDRERGEVLGKMKEARALGVRYTLCGNIGHFALAREADMEIFGDFRLNITNAESAELYRRLGAEKFILSPELTLPKIRDIGGGAAITYGRIPLMLLERCFMRENGGCDRCGRIVLTDRVGAQFPLIREYPHRNLLLNSKITYMGDKRDVLRRYSVMGEHFIFSTESAGEADEIIKKYKSGDTLNGARRIKQ